MPTVVNKLVAYTGGDYTSLNAALAAVPNLVTSDQQWNITIGQSAAGVYEWSISVDNIFNGITTDATRYLTISAQSGYSFKDNASKLTNALRYNGANGIALNIGGGNYFAMPDYTRISNIQIKGAYSFQFGENHRLDNCIVSQPVTDNLLNQASIYTNVVWITAANSAFLNTGGANRAKEYHNCTFLAASPGANSYWVTNYYSTFVLKNCAFFGFVGVASGTSSPSFSSCVNNSTDLPSVPTGFSGTLLNQTATNQFQNTSSGTEDLRVKAGAGLINAGVRDQTYTSDLDIVGQARSTTTPTIGAWEFISVTYTYARPASDITTQWTPSTGTSHYALINEVTPNDADYIFATAAAQTDEVKLGSMTTPTAGSSVNINYRVQNLSGGASVTTSLYCNTTLIKADTARTANGTYTMTVSSAEWASVADWTNMRIRFVSA